MMLDELVSTTTRTLLASGFTVSGCHRQPGHIEIKCERISRLGPMVLFVVAVTRNDSFNKDQIEDIRRSASASARIPAFICAKRSDGILSFEDFLEVFGGAVPSWRALGDDYIEKLETTALNKLPEGMAGEAWLLFEDLVADGLEFVFGRKVLRFGGHRRGQKVSDMVAQIPDGSVIVIDSKASTSGFDATWDSLRPLVEYTKKQINRQQGHFQVIAALAVSSKFKQRNDALSRIAQEFFGETRTALSFLAVDTLSRMVATFRNEPDLRNSVGWKMLFNGGLLDTKRFVQEIKSAAEQRYELGAE